ncbi:hypothetical protein EDL79_04875 [Ehrlichia ruminantium]|uniref:Uncharacterized protein n=1 Tax=Ehrlichia ruminantium TaxID=779 RepID=A0AAE6Q9R3_EHRRU|nr:hypothetical protein [Ehrlichia ruminantium]QGR02932.1 hypothetical protein EDL81_04860 [Ehrlichia ruminantium]QGR03856.1 hypothetical protein EDL80_04865 [Ehrlichia ruminantium]QGR04783.1 hypothetical protein EDL79_04875 [Ehrlichia ruminantium]
MIKNSLFSPKIPIYLSTPSNAHFLQTTRSSTNTYLYPSFSRGYKLAHCVLNNSLVDKSLEHKENSYNNHIAPENKSHTVNISHVRNLKLFHERKSHININSLTLSIRYKLNNRTLEDKHQKLNVINPSNYQLRGKHRYFALVYETNTSRKILPTKSHKITTANYYTIL